MLPPVESDENLIAHGIYQQIHHGKATQVQEFWTVHSLPDTALIWRSQLIYDGVIPLSACYLLRDPEARPMQMVFFWRWQDGIEDAIEYRFLPGHIKILYREQIQDMILPADYEVYAWHTVTEHFLWNGYDRTKRGEQDIKIISPGIHEGTLWPRILAVQANLAQMQILPGKSGPHKGVVFAVDMPNVGAQRLHFDEFGVPLRWELPHDDLRVELAEYTRID